MIGIFSSCKTTSKISKSKSKIKLSKGSVVEKIFSSKAEEIKYLRFQYSKYKKRMDKASSTRIRDWFLLLPTLSISRREPYDNIVTNSTTKETYLGASFQLNKIFSIYDSSKKRKITIRKNSRSLEGTSLYILKLIEIKYVLKKQILLWEKFQRGLKSSDDLVKAIEKIDKLKLLLYNNEISIYKAYLDMEHLCIDIEE